MIKLMLWKYLHKGSLVMLKDTLKHAHTFWNPWLLCGQNYLADLGECGKNLKVDTLPRLFGWSKPNDDCGFPVHRRTRLCNHEGRPCCAMVTTHLSIPYIANVEILALRKFNYAWCLNPKKITYGFFDMDSSVWVSEARKSKPRFSLCSLRRAVLLQRPQFPPR